MINTLLKIDLSKIGWEGGRSTSIWITSLNILFFVFFQSTPKYYEHFSQTPFKLMQYLNAPLHQQKSTLKPPSGNLLWMNPSLMSCTRLFITTSSSPSSLSSSLAPPTTNTFPVRAASAQIYQRILEHFKIRSMMQKFSPKSVLLNCSCKTAGNLTVKL